MTESQRVYASTLRRREREIGKPTRCEICGAKLTRTTGKGGNQFSPHWDHNHETKRGRGWLCKGCNAGLGALGDNPVLLQRAAEYLKERGCSPSRSRLS